MPHISSFTAATHIAFNVYEIVTKILLLFLLQWLTRKKSSLPLFLSFLSIFFCFSWSKWFLCVVYCSLSLLESVWDKRQIVVNESTGIDGWTEEASMMKVMITNNEWKSICHIVFFVSRIHNTLQLCVSHHTLCIACCCSSTFFFLLFALLYFV